MAAGGTSAPWQVWLRGSSRLFTVFAASPSPVAASLLPVCLLGFLVLATGGAACGGGASDAAGGGPMRFDFSAPPAGEPLVSTASADGLFSISLWTSPMPPRKGAVDVLYRIQDAAGDPTDGLAVQVVPWMPAHGHGAAARVPVTAGGQGLYLIAPVYLYMSGRWELRTTIGEPSNGVVVAPSLDIP